MIFESIAIQVSESSPFVMASEFKAGAHADGLSYLGGKVCGTSSLSGIHEPLEVFATTESRLAEGAYIVDKRPCGADGIAAVYSGPMAKVGLPALTISRMWEKDQTFASMLDALACEDTNKGMTFVSLDIYVALWRNVGARIGRKVNGQIVWES